MDLDLRDMGFDSSIIAAIHDTLDYEEETDQRPYHPSRAYVRVTKAMRATPADIVEYPNAYHFIIDTPGFNTDQIKVQIEDNMLAVSGERRREKEHKDAKFITMERRAGKLLKKFVLPPNANKDAISAYYQNGVLTVIVEKLPPPEPKRAKIIEVMHGSHQAHAQGEPGS